MSNADDQLSDQVIVTGILNGNIRDFAVVVKNTEKLVAQIVRKLTTNEDDQKDLVQEIYLKAYQNLPTFQFKSRLSTWIAHIAYNTTINYLQKKHIPITDIAHTMEHHPEVSAHPEQEMINTQTTEQLHAAIARLPPLYQTLITLYHLEELPNKEIAEITSLPEGTIKSYLYRARKMLKDSMYHPDNNAQS